jgi:hypothetical protein
VNVEILTYHRSLFQWHCRHFFNFRRKLHRTEKDYLEACFRLPHDFKEVSEGGYEHFSYYTYSHRVKGDQVNSSRLAYGSVLHPEPAYRAALPVLEYRGIEAGEALTQNTKFYGLGWDLLEDQFKLYFRTLSWSQLHPTFLSLAQGYDPAEHRPEALLSVTFEAGTEVERKLYLYPTDEHLPSGVQGYARMITDRRGEVAQEDVDPASTSAHTFNSVGERILEQYSEIGETLDTVAYNNENDFTLYFP